MTALALVVALPVFASDLSLDSTIVYSPGASTSYDPNSVQAITVSITVRNNSSSDANFFIAVDELVSARTIAMTVNNIECPISLSVKTEGGYDILTPDAIGGSPTNNNSIKGTVRRGRTTTVKAILKPASGYYGPDGYYVGTVTFHCFRYYTSGTQTGQFSVPATVTYVVPSQATLSLSNGTLDFGELSEGESLGMTINVSASRAWDLYVQSQRGGYLQHVSDASSKVWYTLAINNVDFVNLATPTICYSQNYYTSWWWWWLSYDATLTMRVTIGEVPFETEPGIYTDNIWLTIVTR